MPLVYFVLYRLPESQYNTMNKMKSKSPLKEPLLSGNYYDETNSMPIYSSNQTNLIYVFY